MSNKVVSTDRRLAEIAKRQHGVVTARQLTEAGLSRAAITARVKRGRLHRVHRGVYALGHALLTFEGRCMAALLACCADLAKPRVAISHRSAAVVWDLLRPVEAPIHVSLIAGSGRANREGIVIHRPPSLAPTELTLRNHVWATKPARTLRDLARTVSGELHQRAVRRALDLRLVTESDLAAGVDLTRSELERMFLRLCGRYRLPAPEVNARVAVKGRAGFEVDFLWREARVIVETDGFRHHGHRAAFELDRARDSQLQAAGFRILRFTYRQVVDSPGEVAAAIGAVLAHRDSA
jgi:very-short-patch-repair endonuclease